MKNLDEKIREINANFGNVEESITEALSRIHDASEVLDLFMQEVENKQQAKPSPLDFLTIVLVDRFRKYGALFDIKLENKEKKFFAIKTDNLDDAGITDVLKMADDIEKIVVNSIIENGLAVKNIKFNLMKLESLRDKDTFSDLIRGIFWYEVRNDV